MKSHPSPSFLHTRTHVQAGNPASDRCYANRNARSFDCAFMGWPQTPTITLNGKEYSNSCLGNLNEIMLMECLHGSLEPNWWKNFEGCTSESQCLDKAYQKDAELLAKL